MLIVFNEGKSIFIGVGVEKFTNNPRNQLISLPFRDVAAAIVDIGIPLGLLIVFFVNQTIQTVVGVAEEQSVLPGNGLNIARLIVDVTETRIGKAVGDGRDKVRLPPDADV